jgi:lysophospholipase
MIINSAALTAEHLRTDNYRSIKRNLAVIINEAVMNGKKRIFNSLALLLGLAFTTINSPLVHASNLHKESSYDSGNVITYSLGNNHVESIAQWRVAEGKQRAIVLSLHGFGLHKCVYQALAEQLQTIGVATYAMDVRGFGSWSQKAGAKSKFNPNKTLSDVKLALQTLRQDNPGTPVFLLGESMGAALALKAAAQNPDLVSGVIASVPASERYHSKGAAVNLAVRNLLGGGGHVNLTKRLISQATRNPLLREEWKNDPSARLTVSTGELITFSRFMRHNHEVVRQIKDTPVLVLQGTNDRLVKLSGTVRLFNELSSSDKDLLLVDQSEHLILEEGQTDGATLAHLETWLARHEPEQSPEQEIVKAQPLLAVRF